jgi:tetrahydromethanopterin S-methyltransferase subunit B
MDQNQIFQAIGEFKAKIDSLEKSVSRLEACVDKLASSMSDNKTVWQLLLSVCAISSIIGAAIHKPIELLLGMFK